MILDRRAVLAAALLPVLAACSGDDERTIVVYAAVDRRTAVPVIEAFQARTGITVRAVFDSEAAKTVALARRLERERSAPRADVWWSGESLYTALLERAGCFAPLPAGTGDERAVDVRGPTWIGFSGRLRVLVYRKDLWASDDELPARVSDLAHGSLRGRCVMARPTVGTSATHAAWLLRTDAGRTLLRRVRDNEIKLVDGNAHVVRAVAKGQALLGLTDTDDVLVARAEEPRLRMVVPDQGAGESGAVLLPSSAAAISGARNADAAAAFVRFVSGREGERLLARGPAGHLPFGRGVAAPAGLPALGTLSLARLDVSGLVVRWTETRSELERLFPS